jgi:hypothetical protein
MDPDARFDLLRQAFLQPGRDAEAIVAGEIYSLNETRSDGVAFEALAHRLLELDAIAKTRTEDPPDNFLNEAFETYLQTLTTEGHSYYLAYDEVLAIAEAVRANVVVTRREGERFAVVGYHLGCSGAIAVLVMHGVRRGHYERLCTLREHEQRTADMEASRIVEERRHREEQQRREEKEHQRKLEEEERRRREIELKRRVEETEELMRKKRREEEEHKSRGRKRKSKLDDPTALPGDAQARKGGAAASQDANGANDAEVSGMDTILASAASESSGRKRKPETDDVHIPYAMEK